MISFTFKCTPTSLLVKNRISVWLLAYYDFAQYVHTKAGDKIEKNEMGGLCGAVGGGERRYRVLVGKPEETTEETQA
jgi:hypothetical protein